MKNFIPGTRPEWGRELPDNDNNSIVDKNGGNYDNGYNFDEKDDEITYDNLAKQPFDPEEAKRKFEEFHPDAVEDVEKARAMAEAGDPVRMAQDNFNKRLDEAIEKGERGEEITRKAFLVHEAGEMADNREELAGEEYESEKNNDTN